MGLVSKAVGSTLHSMLRLTSVLFLAHMCLVEAAYAQQSGEVSNSGISSAGLSDFLEANVAIDGYLSSVDIEVSQCEIRVSYEYDRPCNCNVEGLFILRRAIVIDLVGVDVSREFLSNENNEVSSPGGLYIPFKSEVRMENFITLDKYNELIAKAEADEGSGASAEELASAEFEQLVKAGDVRSHIELERCNLPRQFVPLIEPGISIPIKSQSYRQSMNALVTYVTEECSTYR